MNINNTDKQVVIKQLTEAIARIDAQEQIERVALAQAVHPDEHKEGWQRIYAQQYASNHLRKIRNFMQVTYAPLDDYVVSVRKRNVVTQPVNDPIIADSEPALAKIKVTFDYLEQDQKDELYHLVYGDANTIDEEEAEKAWERVVKWLGDARIFAVSNMFVCIDGMWQFTNEADERLV
jgi:hypothetical protein